MKGRIFGVLFFAMTCAAFAQDSGFGLGVILGEPTGISAKKWVSSRTAIDAGLAYSFRKNGHFSLHADYLWHFTGLFNSAERFVVYAGPGGRLAAGSGDGVLGLRIVGGLEWWPQGTPLDVFLEFAPIVDLVPATELRGNGGIGVRFFF